VSYPTGGEQLVRGSLPLIFRLALSLCILYLNTSGSFGKVSRISRHVGFLMTLGTRALVLGGRFMGRSQPPELGRELIKAVSAVDMSGIGSEAAMVRRLPFVAV